MNEIDLNFRFIQILIQYYGGMGHLYIVTYLYDKLEKNVV